MVHRRQVVRERLKALSEAVLRLKELRRLSSAGFTEDFRNVWSAERGLQVASEALFDIGNPILAGHFRAAPKDYEDITRLLAERATPRPALFAERAASQKGPLAS